MDLLIRKKNEVYLKVEAEPHINYELADFFTFEVEQAKYMQKQRRWKGWDGKIRLFSPATGEIYCGLLDYLMDWADEKGYRYKMEDCKYFGHPLEQNDFVPAVEQYHDTLGRLVTVTHDPRKQATPEYINQTLDSIEQLKTNVNAKIPYDSALDTQPSEETKTPEPLPSSKSNWPSIIQNAIDNLSKFLSHLKISRAGKYVSDILASVNRATKSFTKASGTGSVKGAVQKPPDKGPK